MDQNRRQFLRLAGASGTSIATVGLSGCSGQQETDDTTDGGSSDDGDAQATRESKADLPEERKIGTKVHVSNTERYYAERYQATVLVDKWFRDELGLDVQTEPVEIGVLADRDYASDFDLMTYDWGPVMGDPDSILVNRFRSDGTLNDTNFNHERYDELATRQRQETDEKKRQELVFECQRIVGEHRPESQYLHTVTPVAYNNERFEEDSVVETTVGLRNIWNYTGIEPKNDDGRTIVTNNWDPTDLLNPLHENTTGPSRNFRPMTFMHDFLVRLDPGMKATPWAAADIEWADETTNVVTLKSGMTFHDGEPVSVDDVAFTFDLILETEPPAFNVFVNDTVDSVEVTGNREITFHLSDVYVPFVAVTLGQVPILPQHYWEELIAETGTEAEPWSISFDDDRPIIGSGPFQYGTWEQGTRFEMPAYKDHSFAAPKIDKRIQRPLATRDAELQALKNGDYDLLDYWLGTPSRLQQEVEATDHLTLAEAPYVGRQACWVNTERKPFDDIAFRQAANALIMEAQDVIINEIYDGFGKRSISPISPDLEFWHNPDTPVFEGIDTAIEILTDAGYEWDEDGNIYHPPE